MPSGAINKISVLFPLRRDVPCRPWPTGYLLMPDVPAGLLHYWWLLVVLHDPQRQEDRIMASK